MAKKVLVADVVRVRIVDPCSSICNYPDPSSSSGLCYTLQMYCDFSGYTDMAIDRRGSSGSRFRELSPVLATSVAGFWRRWRPR
jgi:D-alanyl-lipoteichoic acid acyltransferase DltB (MBOAT superfamily)